jgi:hypothetical protein
MERKHGELMEYLLQRRRSYPTEADFRAYLFESARALSNDLREVGIEIWVRPSTVTATPKQRRDWNTLKVGCE